MNTVIKTVGLEMKWLPEELGSLFFDSLDMNGIMYWYSTIDTMLKNIK